MRKIIGGGFSMLSANTLREAGEPSRHSAAIGFVLATLAVDALGFGIVAPILPDLVMQIAHLSGSAASFWMGLLLATFATMQFLCSPLQGGLSDRFGRRPVLLLSLAGTCVNDLMLAWSPSLSWLFLGQVIAGATAASVSTATAYMADITPPGMRVQRFGLIGSAYALGFVLGPALGGVLGQYWLRLPLLTAAVLAGCNALYGLLLLPESLTPERRRRFSLRELTPMGVWRGLSSDGVLTRLAVAWCCIGIGLGTLESCFVLANQMRLGWSTLLNGLALFALGGIAAVVQTFLLRRVVSRVGNRRTALLGFAVASAAYLCLAFANVGWILITTVFLLALGTMGSPAIQAMASTRSPADRQGEIQGALSSLRGLTAIVAPSAAGSLLALFSGPKLFFPGAPFLVVSMIYAGGFIALRSIAPPTTTSGQDR
jgi:DHA1 family tetracycline resistance protein-like MFS transporter